jgi:TM2 domain-containing membrane protein YozV
MSPPPIYLNPPVGYVQKIPGTHSPGIAALISFFLTGGGQVYNGQTGKGITLLMAAICLGLISYGILGGVIWVITLIDAICVGNKLNQGRVVSKWEFF